MPLTLEEPPQQRVPFKIPGFDSQTPVPPPPYPTPTPSPAPTPTPEPSPETPPSELSLSFSRSNPDAVPSPSTAPETNPLGPGSNPLKPIGDTGPVSAVGAPNTPLTSSDIVRPVSPVPPSKDMTEQINKLTARSLMDVINNPLNIPKEKNDALIQAAQPSGPVLPAAPIEPGFKIPDQPSEGFKIPDSNAPPSTGFQIPSASTGFEAPPEQQYRQNRDDIAELAKGKDTGKLMDSLTKDPNIDLETVQKILMASQRDYEKKDEWDKIADDYGNALQTIGGIATGVWKTVTNPFEPVKQGWNAAHTLAVATVPATRFQLLADALAAGKVSLEDYNRISDQMQAGQNPPLLPEEEKAKEAEPMEQERAKREFASGEAVGSGENLKMMQTAANSIIGLVANNPVSSMIHSMGGPRAPGVIPPDLQQKLLLSGVPISSAQDPKQMDDDQLLSEAMVRRYQANLTRQQMGGYLGPLEQTLLDAWTGGKAHTPDQLNSLAYPLRPKNISDIAGTVNLMEGGVELGLGGILFDGLGMGSLLHEATGQALRLSAGGLEAGGAAASIPIQLGGKLVQQIGKQVEKQQTASGMLVMHTAKDLIKHYFNVDIPIGHGIESWILAKPIGQVVTGPLSGGLKLLGKGVELFPKAMNLFTSRVTDALDTMGSDMLNGTNLLATRTPFVNLTGKAAKSVASGAVETYPLAAAISPNDAEQQGELMGYGILGHGAKNIIPDISDAARNEIGDRLFIRDFDEARKGVKNAAPMRYGSNPTFDAASLKEINRLDMDGNPAYSDAEKSEFHNTRVALNGMAEIHLLPDAMYTSAINDMYKRGILQDLDVNSRGVAVDPNPTGNQARILIRGDPDSLNAALTHEISHPIINRMTPEEINTIFQLYARKNDPNTFTRRYTYGDTDYESLPTEEQNQQAGIVGRTREDMQKEMAAEAMSGLFKGDSINNFTRNPDLIRQSRMVIGKTLERFGIDPMSDVSKSVLGIRQSFTSAYVLDAIVRDALNRNRGILEPPDLTGGTHKVSTPESIKVPKPAPLDPDAQSVADILNTMGLKGRTKVEIDDLARQSQGANVAERVQDALRSSQKPGPTSETAKPPEPTPAERARQILKGRGWSDERANAAIGDDITNVGDSVIRATQSEHGKSAESPQETEPKNAEALGEKRKEIEKEQPFVPSKDWQEKPDWAIVPSTGGLDMRRNSAGKQEVRWAKPPLQEEVTDKRTGKSQKNAAGEEVPPKQEPQQNPTPPEPPPAQSPKKGGKGKKGKSTRTTKPEIPLPFNPAGTPIPQTSSIPNISQAQAPSPNVPETPPAPEKPKDIEKPVPEEPPLETTPEDVEHQEYLNKQEKRSPGESQRIVKGKGKKSPKAKQPKQRKETGAQQQIRQTGPIRPQGEIPDQKGVIGYYGYDGDANWDSKSARGIGSFPHTSHPGSLIPGYSAGLKAADAARRGVVQGQQFKINGRTLRYDDTIPDDSPVGPDYVDVYDPSQPPDPGVTEEQLRYRHSISGNIPKVGVMGPIEGISGESIVGHALGKPGPPAMPSMPSAPQPPEAKTVEIPKEAEPAKEGPTAESIASSEEQARNEIEQGRKAKNTYETLINEKVAEVIGKQHAESLSKDDDRVKYDPVSGLISGTEFVASDPYHDWLLRQQSPDVMETIKELQEAIRNKKEAGKSMLPTYFGVSIGKGEEPNSVYVGGLSSPKISANAAQLTHRLGPESPYRPGPLADKVAETDMRGYISNLSNGWKGDGSAKIKPVPGVQLPKESEGFVPYEMPKERADLWNAAINGGEKLSKKEMVKGGSTSSGRAAMLAKENSGFLTPEGEVNPLLKKIQEETPGWAKSHLHSGFERLKVDLIKKIHASGEKGAPPIYAGHQAITEALQEKGIPPSASVKAGFMPGEIESPSTKPVREEPVQPILTTSDRLKKNEHLRSQLEKQQAKLDTSNPEEDKQWDTLAKRIHDLEREHASLNSGPGKANWMPGDLVENPKTGEQERVGMAALRYRGTIYKGTSHADAYENAETELGYPLRYPSDYTIKELRDRVLPDTGIKPEDEGYTTRPTQAFPEGRYITRDEGWVLGKRHSDLKDTAQKLEESKLQGSATGLRSQDLKSNYMPGETYTNSVGAKVKVTDDSKSEAAPGEWMRYPNKAAYLPAEKAPQEVRESYVDTPERKYLIAGVQQKAKDWLKENQPHPLSAYSERQKIPQGSDMTVEELSDHLMKGKKKLDLTKPSTRESMANAATHDIMTRLSKQGSGAGWYEVIPPAAMKYIADHLDPSILETPENRFIYQVTQAIASQGQDVYANAETGYDAYKYWQKHGYLPTEQQDITGGGISWDQIAGNFRLVNDLVKKHGVLGVENIFNTKMSVKEMRNAGLKIGTGEKPDFQMQGSLALGTKIGPFYASLNKHWENLVMDLWFNRTMNRMSGSMFKFEESPFRKQAATVKQQLLDGQIDLPEDKANRILGEISRIESAPNLSRKSLNKMAPSLLDWAHEQHKVYMKSRSPDPNGPKTYGDKTEVNKNAKNLDQGLHLTQDTPRPGERPLYRDVISRTLQNLHDAGIDLTTADAQAILWYSEQELFGHAGALRKQSDTSDYLDAAYALVKDKKSKGIKPVTKSNQPKILETAGVP